MPLSPALRARLRPLSGVTGVWVGFVVVHALLIWQAHAHAGMMFGDVDLYRTWAQQGIKDGTWPVVDFTWVYPFGALVPVTLPGFLSLDVDAYRNTFLLLVTALDAIAVACLVHRGPRRTLGAWWWLVFLLALGPIGMCRLDGVAAPLTVIALAQLLPSRARAGGRPALATVVATFAAWVKVAPGAVLVPLALTEKRPWRRVVLPAAVVSVVVVGTAAVLGGGSRVLGFLTEQGTRGLQVESGAATPFSIARLWSDSYAAYFNKALVVIELGGPGTHAMASALNVLLVLAVAAIAALTWRAAVNQRRDLPDEDERRLPQLELVLLSTTALTLSLFAFNKVGSPQYVAWFAPPVAVALTAFRPAESRVAGPRAWRVVAVVLVVVAVLTQILYPWRYAKYWLYAVPFDVVNEAVRNIAILALAAGLTVLLGRHARPRRSVDAAPAASAAASTPPSAPVDGS